MHHLYSTAGESKSHGPKGALAGPIGNLIEGSPGGAVQYVYEKSQWENLQSILHSTFLFLLTRQWDFSSWLASNTKWGTPCILCRRDFCGGL